MTPNVDYCEAAAYDFGCAVEGRLNATVEDDPCSAKVDEALSWARENGVLPPLGGLPDPDLEIMLANNPSVAERYCQKFDVDTTDFEIDAQG